MRRFLPKVITFSFFVTDKKRPRYYTLLPHGLSGWHKDRTGIHIGIYESNQIFATHTSYKTDFSSFATVPAEQKQLARSFLLNVVSVQGYIFIVVTFHAASKLRFAS